jgi:hypothetical protein
MSLIFNICFTSIFYSVCLFLCPCFPFAYSFSILLFNASFSLILFSIMFYIVFCVMSGPPFFVASSFLYCHYDCVYYLMILIVCLPDTQYDVVIFLFNVYFISLCDLFFHFFQDICVCFN